MSRKVVLGAASAVLVSIVVLASAGSALASTTTRLVMGQGPAFAILGHSCGGIQEKVYATGFAASGYPQGDALLETRCGGSGRGGGYKTTTYTAWASVVWSWYGETRSYARLEGAAETNPTFSAEDSHQDRIYNSANSAYLETTEPPVQPPAAPTNVTAYVQEIESGNLVYLRFQVGWTPDQASALLISSSKIVATPVGSTAPVVEATIGGGGGSGLVGPLERRTTYSITVTSSDAEGTSQPSAPIEVNSITAEEEAEKKAEELEPKPPEFGRCVKAESAKEGTVTYWYGAYTSANCELTSATHSGKHEWSQEIAKKGFTTAIKPLTKVVIEGTGRGKVICTGETGSGEISGAKTVGSVVMTLTGCESAGAKCTTAGLVEGEVRTSSLEGTLGVRTIIEKEGKEILYPALDLFPPGKAGPVAEYACAGETTTLSGSVIVPETGGKMGTTSPLKWSQAAGLQNPEAFEEGPPDVLRNQIGEQVGLSLSATQTNEQAVEINRKV